MFKFSSQFYFDNGLKIKVNFDLIRYYMWHLYRNVDTIGLNYPKHKAHISVILPRIHGKEITEKSKNYVGQSVDVCYNGDVRFGGSWFLNAWLPVECERAEQIKKELGVKEENFLGFHLTIANNKSRINELYIESSMLSQQMNKGEFTIDEFREKMRNEIQTNRT